MFTSFKRASACLIALAALALGTAAHAQTAPLPPAEAPVASDPGPANTERFRFGVYLAPGLGWIKSDANDLPSKGSRIGFSYGMVADINFGTNYALSTGVDVLTLPARFQLTGANVTNNVGGVDTTITYATLGYNYTNIQYIQIPVQLKMRTNEIGYLTYFFTFGGAPGFMIRARAEAEDGVTAGTTAGTKVNPNKEDVQQGVNEEFNNAIAPLRLALLVGAGAEYNLGGRTSVFAAIKFNNGLTDILSDNNRKAINNVIQLQAGILF